MPSWPRFAIKPELAVLLAPAAAALAGSFVGAPGGRRSSWFHVKQRPRAGKDRRLAVRRRGLRRGPGSCLSRTAALRPVRRHRADNAFKIVQAGELDDDLSFALAQLYLYPRLEDVRQAIGEIGRASCRERG